MDTALNILRTCKATIKAHRTVLATEPELTLASDLQQEGAEKEAGVALLAARLLGAAVGKDASAAAVAAAAGAGGAASALNGAQQTAAEHGRLQVEILGSGLLYPTLWKWSLCDLFFRSTLIP